MTDTQTEEQPAVRPIAVRRLETTITAGDGRTLSFRIAPFREHAVSADGLGGLPKGQPYKEELMPGLYDRQLKAANRILLNFEHQQGIAGVVGHGIALRMEQDGYHADFRIHETPDGDKALLLAKEGVLHGASVESYWLKSIRSASGIVQRVKAHLEAVAMCREGAYPSAVLTGMRADEIVEDIILDESLLPITPDPEMIERCRQLGIKLPQRMMAHPDDTDTPAETGTSENGTRQDQATANLGGDE